MRHIWSPEILKFLGKKNYLRCLHPVGANVFSLAATVKNVNNIFSNLFGISGLPESWITLDKLYGSILVLFKKYLLQVVRRYCNVFLFAAKLQMGFVDYWHGGEQINYYIFGWTHPLIANPCVPLHKAFPRLSYEWHLYFHNIAEYDGRFKKGSKLITSSCVTFRQQLLNINATPPTLKAQQPQTSQVSFRYWVRTLWHSPSQIGTSPLQPALLQIM